MSTEPKRRGRPPLYDVPPTAIGRWARGQNMTAQGLADRLAATAPLVGLDASAAPKVKSVVDLIAGRYAPSPAVMLLVRHATAGEVDLEHWVQDRLVADLAR